MNKIEFDVLWEETRKKIGFTLPTDSIGSIISKIIPLIFTISGILLLIFLIIGGLQFMLSGGDPKKAQAAQGKITTAIIGFFIIFVSYWIVQLLGKILGIATITNIFK